MLRNAVFCKEIYKNVEGKKQQCPNDLEQERLGKLSL